MKAPHKCSLTYFINQNVCYQTLPTFCWRKVKHLKVLMRSTKKEKNSFWGSRQTQEREINQWLCRTILGRGGKTWVKNGKTFDWLKIYKPINYFPFSTRIFKNRNMFINILILMIILALKTIKIKETTISSSIPPNLETNFTKFLKRGNSFKCEMKYAKWSTVCCSSNFHDEYSRWRE